MGLLQGLRRIDSFRFIPPELTEATAHGGWFTILAWIIMVSLFWFEYGKFTSVETRTGLALDKNKNNNIKIRFDVTMLDLPCTITSVDTVDYFGNEHVNVTKDIEKISLHYITDHDRYYEGTTSIDDDTMALKQLVMEERDAIYNAARDNPDTTKPGEQWESVDINSLLGRQADNREAEVDKQGHHAYELDPRLFGRWLKQHDLSLVNFYAPWCSHCQRLHPVWEKAATEVDTHLNEWQHELKVKFANVNCVTYKGLCEKTKIKFYPSIRLYKGADEVEEYNGFRTEAALVAYFLGKVTKFDQVTKKIAGVELSKGCRVKGTLTVPRAPGNFHIEASSTLHNTDPRNANVSHIIDTFEFGIALAKPYEERLPDTQRYNLRPLEDQMFVVQESHQAPQHFVNVVPTSYNFGSVRSSENSPFYQMTTQSRTVILDEAEIPKAQFSFHISPVSLVITHTREAWYQFVTSACAIVGGTYTVIKIFSDSLTGIKSTIGKLE